MRAKPPRTGRSRTLSAWGWGAVGILVIVAIWELYKLLGPADDASVRILGVGALRTSGVRRRDQSELECGVRREEGRVEDAPRESVADDSRADAHDRASVGASTAPPNRRARPP